MTKRVTDKPTGSTVVWHIQKRLRERGHDISTDGDLGPKTFWDSSETLRAILKELGGEIAQPKPPAAAPSSTGKRVFIDVGHGRKPGGFDPGAVHASSRTTEHSLNLTMAAALSDRLRQRGVEVRVADEALENYNAGTAARGFDVFVSLHHNAAVSPAQGSLVLYDPRNNIARDRPLAELVSARIAQELGIRDRGAKEMRLAVLSGARAAGVPVSVLVEPYFIHEQTPANPPAADMPDWSSRAGRAIADALADHLGA